MNRKEFDNLEIEANASPVICSHHVHIPRGYRVEKLLKRIERETLDQLEPGQNLGAYPLGYESAFIPKID